MTVHEYKLPDVGEGLTEAEIVSWRVKAGDTVAVNDVVVEIETAKSLVELPSPYAGTVTALLVEEGTTVPVGTPIISVDDGVPAESALPAPGEGVESALPAPSEGVESAPPAPGEGVESAPPARSGGGSQGAEPPSVAGGADAPTPNLVGYGPRSGSARRRARRGPATAATHGGSATQLQVQGSFALGRADTSEVVPGDEPPVPATPARESVRPSGAWSVGTVLAKPPVRKLARDLGVDLASVSPSGPGGVVTPDDVHAAAGSADSTVVTGQEAPARQGGLEERREPVKGVRKMMAQAMVRSAFTAPHVTEWVTVDVTRTRKLVDSLRRDRAYDGLSVSPLLVAARAVCLATRRTPELNAHWDDETDEVVYSGAVNLGIAAATPRGLVVPNVKGADRMPTVDLARALTELTATAREGRTQPADMAGGTFTITNVGVFGVDAGTPIINPGEGAILALGAVRKQPWVHKGKVRPRDVTTLALSFDHRFIDGAAGSRFLADVAALMNDPARALTF